MNVIKVSSQIVFVTNDVIPETVLPHPTGAMTVTEGSGMDNLEMVYDVGDRSCLWMENGVQMIR